MNKNKIHHLFTTLYILLFSWVVFCSFNSSLIAFGDTTDDYARILDDDVYFYGNETLSPSDVLFVLPKGYYVKVISAGELYFECVYADSSNDYSKILGFIEKDNVELCEGVSPLYPSISLSTISQTNMYSDPSASSEVVVSLFSGQSVEFYGYAVDHDFLFVKAGNDFGYINIKSLETPKIKDHPIPLPTMPSPSPTPTPNPSDEPAITEPISSEIPTAIQVMLVIFILIPVVIISIFLFSKKIN